MTLHLRFADAKHTNTDRAGGVGAQIEKMVGKAELVHKAIAKAVAGINEAPALVKKQKQGAEVTNTYTAIVAKLRRDKRVPEGTDTTLEVAPFLPRDRMLCHDRDDDTMLSPATFTWEPWSRLLFCMEESPCGPEGST